MATLYDARVFISGNVIEIYSYSETRARGFSIPTRSIKHNTVKQIDFETGELLVDYGDVTDKLRSRMKSNIRARNEVRRLVLSNFDKNSKFMTLTFRENLQDLDEANRCFKLFLQSVNRYLASRDKQNMKYIAVVEFQKRGAIHYHVICDLKGFPANRLWGFWKNATGSYDGGVDIKRITHVDNVGAYVTKYMVKDLEKADERLIGKKCYQRSKNLERPVEFTLDLRKEKDAKIFEDLLKDKKITYENDYEDKFTGGTVTYREINLSRQK